MVGNITFYGNILKNVLSVLDQQFVGFGGNWIEIAYGTSAGTVCIIVQHPETLGQGPQLFQTFSVHCSPVIRVMISEKHLVSGIFDSVSHIAEQIFFLYLIYSFVCLDVHRVYHVAYCSSTDCFCCCFVILC